MKLYNIFYIDNSKQKHYEATTDNFHKWLKDHNDNREKGYEDDEDDFTVEEISLFVYEDRYIFKNNGANCGIPQKTGVK